MKNMKKPRLLFLSALVLLVLLIPALPGAAHGDSSDVKVAGYYLAADNDPYYGITISLWEETNGDPGLQRTAHCHPIGSCNEGVTTIPADTIVFVTTTI